MISGCPSPLTSPTATRTPCWYVAYGENASGDSPQGAHCCAAPPCAFQPRTSGQPASCPVTIEIGGGAALPALTNQTAAARTARRSVIEKFLRCISELPSSRDDSTGGSPRV